MPFVSWLICADQPGPFLLDALSSCLNQSYQDFDVYLVANGLHRLAVINQVQSAFPHESRIHILETPITGLTFSLSFGATHISSPYIARMDSDDISCHRRLEDQLAYLSAYPSTTVLGSAYTLIDNYGSLQSTTSLPTSHEAISNALVWSNPICHPSTIINSSSLFECGGYIGGDKAEDYNLWLRLLSSKTAIFANLPSSYLFYRSSGRADTRGSTQAFASVAAARLNMYANGHGHSWLLSSAIATARAFLA